MDCGTLDDIDNGGVVMSTSTFDSTATYTCEEGYDLSDDVERTCQADGSWDGDEPECIRKYMHKSSCDISSYYKISIVVSSICRDCRFPIAIMNVSSLHNL